MWLFRRHELPSPTLRAVRDHAPAAHRGAVYTRHFRPNLISIEAACSAARSELAVQPINFGCGVSWNYASFMKQFMTARVNNGV
jgi:hypothetical protein